MGRQGTNIRRDPRNYRALLLARDRIRVLLEPLLDAEIATERANNIAQVLLFTGEDVAVVAGMLRGFDLGDTLYVAEEVVRVWQGQTVEPFVEVRVA